MPNIWHLLPVIEVLHRLIVESVLFLLAGLLRPNQGLRGICKPGTTKTRHGIDFIPNDIIKDPVSKVLHNPAHTEDVVIGTYNPERAGIFKHSSALREPLFGEAIIFFKIGESIPFLIHAVNERLVGS